MANKVKYGLRNVVYAVMSETDGVISYGTPAPINGAVNISLSAVGDNTDFYADDTVYFNQTANQGYEGDLEIALIPDDFKINVMGEVRDSNGALIENADAKPKAFALGFEVQGDAKGRRTWLYNCKASRSNQDAQTTEAGITPATETLSLKAMPRLTDKKVKASLENSETSATAYNNFFDEVYESTASI